MLEREMRDKGDVIPITAGLRNPRPVVSARRVRSGIAITIGPGLPGNYLGGVPSLSRTADFTLAGANTNDRSAADLEEYDAVRYLITKDDRVRVLPDGVPEPEDAELVFSTAEELQAGVAEWPLRRLVTIWNKLPEVKAITRFENRQVAAERIWRAIERVRQQFGKSGGPRPREKAERRRNKTELIIGMLQQPSGATLQSLMEATHWQTHSVRGFLSGKLSKERGLLVKSFRREGERVYALQGGVPNGTDLQ